MELTLYLAFIAGLVSFISPCVLPLVPAYVGYMGGRMTHTVATAGGGQVVPGWNHRLATFVHSLFFVAGFAFVFVTFGLLSTAFISVIGGDNINTVTNLIGRLGGVLIIFFGLHFMGVLPHWLRQLRQNDSLTGSPLTGVAFALLGSALLLWGFSGYVFIWDSPLWEYAAWAPIAGLIALAAFLVWLFLAGAFTTPTHFWHHLIDRINGALYADTRRDMQTAAGGGYSSSAIMGVVFSAGWTPCIGPVYGAVLTMAANGGDVGQAGALLAAYSLGLGIPFMLTALALDSVQGIFKRLQRHMHKIELAAGAFLVIIGIAVASGQLQSLSQRFSTGEFAEFAISVEENIISAVNGQDENADQSQSVAPTAAPADSASNTNTAVKNDLIVSNPSTRHAAPPRILEGAAVGQEKTDSPLNSITALAASGGPSVGISEGNIAPDFETVTDGGRLTRLSDFRGQVVLLNFWATWCGPCRTEMPEFEAQYAALKDQGFTILAVNNQESVAKVQDFREELGLSFPLLIDERGDIQIRYAISSYPITFLINREGIILHRSFGPMTAGQIDEMVAQALAA